MCRVFTLTPVAMKVLAIDPGYDRLGIAVIEGDASRPSLIMSTCLIPEKGAQSDRLAAVAGAISAAIIAHAPDVLGIETLFFSANKKTALGVAEARGAVLAAAGLADLRVIECTPQEVKIAVTGNGRADKSAVARMIPRLISLPPKKRLDDEIDAIAVGITTLSRATQLQ